jgi:hypothetical protein
VKIDSSLAQAECVQTPRIVVRYQRRFAAHLDEVVDCEVGERFGREFQMLNVIAIGAGPMA